MNPTAPRPTEFLPAGKAFVWLTRPEEVTQPDLLARYAMLLNDEERHRFHAFHFADDRHLYLVAHALLRTSLSRYADIQPDAWVFSSVEKHGRPEIAFTEACGDRIRFSLSHTRGLTACVITRNVDVGIDVECLDRQVDAESIATRYFAPSEALFLAGLSSAEQNIRFLQLWTLKESYVKARGGGLSIPLDSFHFARDEDGAWQIGFSDSNDDPDAWQFTCMSPTPNHVMSVALHRPRNVEYQLEVQSAVPLTPGA